MMPVQNWLMKYLKLQGQTKRKLKIRFKDNQACLKRGHIDKSTIA